MGKCLRCVQCWYYTVILDKKPDPEKSHLVRTGIKCEHLMEDKTCKIYDHRPGWCMSAEQMLALEVLPDNCGYLTGG